MATATQEAPTILESMTRVQRAMDRILQSLKDHNPEECENCKAYERDREERGVQS